LWSYSQIEVFIGQVAGPESVVQGSPRQNRSKPLDTALGTWLEQQLARVSAKSSIAEEIRYGLNQLDGLHPFPR
jgi:hypothetical protein